jgi:hypothetical protein
LAKGEDVEQGNIFLPTLNSAQVARMKINSLSQLLLGEVGSNTVSLDSQAESSKWSVSLFGTHVHQRKSIMAPKQRL